jgi:NitT/TauT family transport system substrate-binding protein
MKGCGYDRVNSRLIRVQGRPFDVSIRLVWFAFVAAALMTVGVACGDDDDGTEATVTPAGTTDTPPQDLGSLSMIGVGVGFSSTLPLLAIDGGFFEEEGFGRATLDVTGGGQTATAALVRGDADVSTAGMTEILQYLGAGGNDVVVIGAGHKWQPIHVTVSNEWVTEHSIALDAPLEDRIAALTGARVAVLGAGSTVEVFARYMYEFADLNPDRDASLVPFTSPGDMLAAMGAGGVDVLVVADPFTAQAEAAGEITLISAGEFPLFEKWVNLVLTVRKSDLESQPEYFDAFCRAIVRAGMALVDDPDEALNTVRERFSAFDPDVLTTSWERETQPEGGIYMAAQDPALTVEHVQPVLDFVGITNVNPEDVFDNSCIEKAMADVGS